MTEQLQLIRQRPLTSTKRQQQLQRVVELLGKKAAWMEATDIAKEFGANATASFKRRMRELAEIGAPVIVSYPGSPGFKHWNSASVDEINHAIEAHESQGKLHFKRANVYRMAYHRRFRAEAVIRLAEVQRELVGT